MTRRRPRASLVLVRGILRRCPRCGSRGLFKSFFSMHARCPDCDLPTERGEGFWLGGMAINLGLTELVFGAFLVGSIIATWPDPPWTLLLFIGLGLNAVLPVLFYPFAQAVFLGVDMLMFRMDPMRTQPPTPYDVPDEKPSSG
ncbi:MAG: DUF983 domain-containing protein [Actinobacteria bacterium]|nr:DUF983 domain-containing protein [Actinomycetota bacterium]